MTEVQNQDLRAEETPKAEEAPLKTKSVVQLDAFGYFVGMTIVDEDPMERGTFQLPPLARDDIKPPVLKEGQRARWGGKSWSFEGGESAALPDPDVYRVVAKTVVDRMVDSIYALTVGARATEYQMAALEARSYLLALNTREDPDEVDVPISVQEWAEMNRWDAKKAALDVVKKADLWEQISLREMRPGRLSAKKELDTLNDAVLMKQVLDAWVAKINAWRSQLDLPLVTF